MFITLQVASVIGFRCVPTLHGQTPNSPDRFYIQPELPGISYPKDALPHPFMNQYLSHIVTGSHSK